MLTATIQVAIHIRESWRFKLMYIPQEKLDTHNMYAPMTSHTQQPFTLTQQNWMDPTAPEKKVSHHNPQHAGGPIYESHTSFSRLIAVEAIGKS
jgi:hypothetical protein